ncbi:MAG TPA: VanZ family protein [Thermoanaerobaculia bacterium]|nr:VanZ family protein [Thermoanaerobaculia bacterium]
MWVLPVVAIVTCIAFALRRTKWSDVSLRVSRWTYAILIPLSLLYFPLQSGVVRPVECEWTFNWRLAIYSLGNYAHIAMFAIFFVLTLAQLRNVRRAMTWSFIACLVMGFLVEIAEGASGVHHCRMRDLIPDMAGASVGFLVVWIARRALTLRPSLP